MKSVIKLTKWFFIFFCTLECAYTQHILKKEDVHLLNVGDKIVNNKPGLKIYCHNAESKYLSHIWKVIIMHLDINSEQYTLYYGKTPDEIYQQYNEKDKSLNFFDSISFVNKFKINPFKDICIGVYMDSPSESKYIMNMTERSIDDWSFTMMIAGILIFWYAQMLCQKSNFYYACGTLFGVIISILILVYVVWKLVQQCQIKIEFKYLIFAGSMSVFLAHILSENIQLISELYKEWIILYILISSLISFMICYRFGPITNPRTKQITQWLLQIIGLALIYTSSYLHEASFFCCLILAFLYKLLKTTPEQEMTH